MGVTRLRNILLLLSAAVACLAFAPAAFADAPASGVPVCSPVGDLLDGLSGALGLGNANSANPGTINFSQSSYTANENAGQVWLTITRTNTAGEEQIRYGVKQDTAQSPWDFDAVPNTLATLVPGQASCQFPVTIVDNGMNGPSLAATAYLFGSSHSTLPESPDNDTLTILRNDPLDVRNSANPLGVSPAPSNGDPLTGAQFYVQSAAASGAGQAAQSDLRSGDMADASALNFIAQQPFGYRFWYWNVPDPANTVSRYLENAQYAQPGKVVELSTYSLVHGACPSTANGNFTSQYLNWVRGLAQGIGNFHVVLFFEVDSLITSPCLSHSQLHIRLVDQLKPAIQILEQDPHVAVYLDAGASDALTAHQAAARLRAAGVQNAQGFFINSTHFQWDTTEIAYGQKISRLLGGHVHFLVNSGVNGRGPLLNAHPMYQGIEDLCNPAGRGLGTMSTQTGYENLDGLLWFAPVGNSGGACRAGAPPTAVFWPGYAVSLFDNRHFGITGPHVHLIRSGTYAPYSAAFAG